MKNPNSDLNSLFSLMFQAHPWHGVSAGAAAPGMVTAFVEIVPSDTVKYELDKSSGHLKIDRPQQYSSLCPMPYGFVPQTFCGAEIADFCRQQSGLEIEKGDGDPLDICILTEKIFTHGNILIQAKPIGGLRMIEKREADDKIIAVLREDVVFGHLNDLSECPLGLVNRLLHYFLNYKESPHDPTAHRIEIPQVYGRDEAFEVIRRSQIDYRTKFGAPEARIDELKQLLRS